MPSTILEFRWLVIYGFMNENGLGPSPKRDISPPPQYLTLFEIHIQYFSLFFIYTGNFQVPPEKIAPTQSTNFHPKSQSDLTPYNVTLKNGSTFPPSSRGDANYEITLDRSLYIFNCNKTAEVIILKYKGILK